ncbi:hypothetical protein [Synechococcus sp. MVIR-18-1]|nr:hypothetical protein [Synechococcus sp. MVIR-18-1]
MKVIRREGISADGEATVPTNLHWWWPTPMKELFSAMWFGMPS